MSETTQRTRPPPKATVQTAEPPPAMWVALWDYKAQDESELNMVEGEQVTVKNKGNGEGWWLAASTTGKVSCSSCELHTVTRRRLHLRV